MNERIKQYRVEAGLTLDDLATQIGMSVPTVAKIESGARVPSVSTLLKMHKVLGMDLHWVLTGDELE